MTEPEIKKLCTTFVIPKDAFVGVKPINPDDPLIQLAMSNIEATVTAAMFGVSVEHRLAVYSEFLKAWVRIGPATHSYPRMTP